MGGDISVNGSIAQERVATALGKLFTGLDSVAPENRFKISAALLQVGDLKAQAFSEEEFARIQDSIGDTDAAMLVADGIRYIRDRLAGLGLTYLSTNYWSPAVRYRQSAVACEPSAFNDVLRMRYAIAFFDITAEAEQSKTKNQDRPTYSSLVLYLAKYARRACPTLTVFSRNGDSSLLRQATNGGNERLDDAIIDITDDENNKSTVAPPFVTALARLVEEHADSDRSADNVEALDRKMLRDCFLFGRPSEPSGWLLSLRGKYQSEHEDAVERTRRDPAHYHKLEELTAKLRHPFEEPTLSEGQVAFLVGMQVLWRRAFHGDALYAFPTVVNSKRCVLTAGAPALASNEQRSLLSSFGRSLFSNLLLLDYASAQVADVREAYQNFVAHNLPKLVFSPAAAELQVIERMIGSDRTPSAAELRDANAGVRRLQSLFGHYESLMARRRFFEIELTKSAQEVDKKNEQFGFPTRLVPIGLKYDIEPQLYDIFDALRERILDDRLREALELDIVAQEDLEFRGDPEFLTEILVNFIGNSIDAIDPKSLDDGLERNKITLEIGMETESRGVRFVVQDRGEGFEAATLRKIRDQIDAFAQADQEEWKALVGEIRDRRDLTLSSLDGSGLGLPTAMAYLRQLKWYSDLGERPGTISIGDGSRPDNPDVKVGARVEIFLPQLDRDIASPPREEISTARADASTAPSVCLLTTDQGMATAWARRLPRLKQISDYNEARNYDVAVIDAEFRADKSPHSAFKQLNKLKSAELVAQFRDPERIDKLPYSVYVLTMLDRLRAQKGQPGTIVIRCKNPAPSVIQELVLAGADIVCQPATTRECIAEIDRLPPEERYRPPTRPRRVEKGVARRLSRRVFVVENNRSVCLSLRKRLSNFELVFVGEKCSGNSFKVSGIKAKEDFDSRLGKGETFAAIISDLALDDWTELEAARGLPRRARIAASIEDTVRAMAHIRDSARAANDPDLPIIFLSDYITYTKAHEIIAKHFPGGYFSYPKTQRGFEELEQHMDHLHPGYDS